jgi:hypothetical protein
MTHVAGSGDGLPTLSTPVSNVRPSNVSDETFVSANELSYPSKVMPHYNPLKPIP